MATTGEPDIYHTMCKLAIGMITEVDECFIACLCDLYIWRLQVAEIVGLIWYKDGILSLQ